MKRSDLGSMSLMWRPSSRRGLVAGSMLALTVAAFGLSGCELEGAKATDCWNPKLLRVKVGTMVLDLPRGVDLDSWDGKKPDGLLKLRYEDWAGNRIDCQKKDHVPLDYGPRAHLVMRNRPVERDYILGALYDNNDKDNKNILDFSTLYRSRIERKSNIISENSRYLSDYKNAAASIFVGTEPGDSTATIEDRLYIFRNESRKYTVSCQICAPYGRKSVSDPPFPCLCKPGWRFLMGDLVVQIDAQGEIVRSVDGKRFTAPANQWPQKWSSVLDEIASYIVPPARRAQP